jgi:hypothetical protein
MKKTFIPFLIFMTGFLASCFYNNEESLYHANPGYCDTTVVTFGGTILPLLRDNCWVCHSNANSAAFGGKIRLEDYSDVSLLIGHVIATINHEPGHPQMPKNGNKLSNCNIAKFEIWARMGALNN